MILIASIQTLRVISIFLVILFHLDIFKFGFLGVDMFFVISGYLMFSMYNQFDDFQDISIFYKKRFARIFPSLLAICSGVILIGYMSLLPNEFTKLIKESVFSLIGVSNITYWLDEQYFSNLNFRPLLNTWSLSVELQFYLIFPFIVKYFNSKKKMVLICLSSFLAYEIIGEFSNNSTFFLTPFRLWEFIIGGLLVKLNKNDLIKSHITALLTIIMLYVLHVDYLNLVAVYFASIYILHTPRILSNLNAKISGFGKFTYLAYLIHLPLIIFLNYKSGQGNIYGFADYNSLTIFVLSLSILTGFCYKFVEKPSQLAILRYSFKSNQIKSSKLIITLILLCTLALPNSFLIPSNRNTGVDYQVARALNTRDTYRCGPIYKLEFLRVFNKFDFCKLNSGSGKNYLLIGNSHADSIKYTISKLVAKKDGNLWFPSVNSNLNSSSFKKVTDFIESRKIEIVILHSSYKSTDYRILEKFAYFLLKRNITLNILGPVPTYQNSVPLKLLNVKSQLEFQTLDKYYQLNHEDIKEFASLSMKYKNVFFTDLGPIFCANKCRLFHKSEILYFDHGHLNIFGAVWLSHKLNQLIL